MNNIVTSQSIVNGGPKKISEIAPTPEQEARLIELSGDDAIPKTLTKDDAWQRNLLSCLLQDKKVMAEAYPWMQSGWFSNQAHVIAYQTLQKYWQQNEVLPTAQITMDMFLERIKDKDKAVILHLKSELQTVYDYYKEGLHHSKYYLQGLKTWAYKQKVMLAAHEFLQKHGDNVGDVEDITLMGEHVAKAINLLQEAHVLTSSNTGYKFEPITGAQLDKEVYTREWLVEKMLVFGQPTIIGGPKKALKTNIMTDLTISLGSGTPFLGKFPTRLTSCCLISGESGKETIQETARRIAKSKDLLLGDCQIWFDFRLPKLSIAAELGELSRGLAKRKIEVAFIDPLYLCLLAGGGEKSATNVFDMGEVLADAAKACLDAGTMPCLCHHTKKNMQAGAALDLDDLAYSGVQEFARQWLLLSRREKFVPGSGFHELLLSTGGSSGQSSKWGLDIDEGELAFDFSGRHWDVKVLTTEECREKANLKKSEDKIETKQTKDQAEAQKLLSLLDTKQTKTSLSKKLGWYKSKFDRICNLLMANGEIVLVTGPIATGNNAEREAEFVMKVTPPKDMGDETCNITYGIHTSR